VKYRTIVADPPWPIDWSGGAAQRRNGRDEIHRNARAADRALPYPTLSIDQIANLDVPSLVDDDAALFLWIPDRLLLTGIAPQVVRTWGFRSPRLFVWHKSGYGLGTFPRPQHEIAIVATRGRSLFIRRDVGSVQAFPIVYESEYGKSWRKHSAKPPAFLDLVESASPGPYLELFARSNRLGWDTWGDEAFCHVDLTVEQR
jgi:N6-adenosine-specific RNA methylase IME4